MKKVFSGYSDMESLFSEIRDWCDEKQQNYESKRRYDADDLTIVVEIIDERED